MVVGVIANVLCVKLPPSTPVMNNLRAICQCTWTPRYKFSYMQEVCPCFEIPPVLTSMLLRGLIIENLKKCIHRWREYIPMHNSPNTRKWLPMVQQTDQIHNNIFHCCFQSNNVEDGIMKANRMRPRVLIETSDVFVYNYFVYAAL